MTEEACIEFRLRKIDEKRDYLLDEIKINDLMNEKYKKTCKYLNYVENLLIPSSTITGCISVYRFASLFCVPVGIASSTSCNAGIKKYKSIIKKMNKRHDKIVLL